MNAPTANPSLAASAGSALSRLAREICPNWMHPTGDAHYRDTKRALEMAYNMGFLDGEKSPNASPSANGANNEGGKQHE